MWRVQFHSNPAAGFAQRVSRTGWALKIALLAAAAVLIVPVVALVLLALAVGVAVFVVLGALGLAFWILRRVLGAIAGNSGRKNVRVIRRPAEF